MKYFSVLYAFLLLSIGASAQERYFHELRGFEDSTGTTQLFYRLSETYTVYVDSWFRENHVRHFNPSIDSDSIIFRSQEKDWNVPGYVESEVLDYAFYNNSLKKWSQLKTHNQGFAPHLKDYRSKAIEFPFPIIIKVNEDHNYYSPPKNLITDPSGDSIYTPLYLDNLTISFSSDTAQWPDFGDDYDAMISYFDSTHFDYELLDIHPDIDSLYFGVNEQGVLFRSEKYSSAFEVSDSSIFYSELYFDRNSSIIYGANRNSLTISSNYGYHGSWSEVSIPKKINRLLFVSTDRSTSGSLFIADSNSVYHTIDYGSSFEKLLDFDSEITGLYKKPNSDILYVLTRTDLYEVENGQLTSIKQIPVSSETEPEIPERITLHQNYPNPFNPSTTIRFDLKESAFTKLTVYDLLGRKVKELVNEVLPAGTNTVQFNATDLASGVYLYRLEAGSFIQTKRLTLIK